MSRKSPRRLAEIMRAYRLARGLDEVAYLTPAKAEHSAIAQAAHGVSKVQVGRLQDMIPMRSWPPRLTKSDRRMPERLVTIVAPTQSSC